VLQLTVLGSSGKELAEQLGDTDTLGIDVEQLTDSFNRVIYASFMVGTLLYQGGMARYFSRRRSLIESYSSECPEWARRVVMELGD